MPTRKASCLASLMMVGSLLGALPVAAEEPTGVSALTAPLLRPMAAAEAALENQERQLAESHFRDALQEGWMLRGALEAAAGRLEAARDDYRRAAAVAVETRRPHTALALLHLQDGQAREAIGLLRGVVVRNPDSGTARRLLAQALVAAGRPEEAVQELAERYAAAPEDLETVFALASGYLQVGKVEAADALFAVLAEARPIPQTWILIGRTYRDFRQWERARMALETALRLDPGVRRAHYYLGTLELLTQSADGLPVALERFQRELERFPEDPMATLYYGLALAETRRFAEAIPPLEAAAAWPPARLDALRYLGRCHLGLGDAATAVEYLDQARQLAEEGGARPRQLYGILYQRGLAARQMGELEAAAGFLAEAERYSAQLVAGEREGLTAFLEDEPAEGNVGDVGLPAAVQRIAQMGAGERDSLRATVETALTRATFNLGVLQTESQRFDRALEFFETAAGIDPDFPQLAYSLGVAAFNAQDFATAAEALERARRIPGGESQDTPEVRRMLALAHLNLDAYAEAAELLAEDPRRGAEPSLQYAYALALVRSAQPELTARAEGVFQALLANHGDWPELHVLLGQAHAQDGDFDSAIASLRQALNLNPAVGEAHRTLGILYLKQGRLDEAEAALGAELEHHPDDLSARYHLAVVLDLNQRPEAAREALEIVLQARPQYADARYLLGKIRLAAGAPEEAAAHLEAAAALAPEDANIRYQLAQAYQRLGQRQRAQEEFATYRSLKGRGEEP